MGCCSFMLFFLSWELGNDLLWSSEVSVCYWEISTLCLTSIIFIFPVSLNSNLSVLQSFPHKLFQVLLNVQFLVLKINEFCCHISNKQIKTLFIHFSAKTKTKTKSFSSFYVDYRNFEMASSHVQVSRFLSVARLTLVSEKSP